MVIDFGNGVTASTDLADGLPLIVSASGHDVPDVDVPVAENGLLDGGVVGTPHVNARRMTFRVYHNATWTRFALMRLFTPGVERTISSTRGSMPYYVERLSFPDPPAQSEVEFIVSIVSSLAYPEGSTLTARLPGTTITQTTENANTEGVSAGQTVQLTGGETLTRFTLKSSGGGTSSVATARIYATAAGKATGAALATSTSVSVSGMAAAERDFEFDYVIPETGLYAILVSNNVTLGQKWRKNTAGGYASGDELTFDSMFPVETNAIVTGDDLYFKVLTNLLVDNLSSVTFDADTDVPCAPVITLEAQSISANVVIAGTGWTCTITGPFAIGDDIVIDSDAHTVSLNGTVDMDMFLRTGDWPELSPGENTITVTPTATTAITWKPRRMGLL